VWELAARVKSRHDVGLTVEAMTADIPIGAALRRIQRWQAAAFGWSAAATVFGGLGRLRRPATLRLIASLTAAAGDRRPLDLTKSTKPMGARVEIRLVDGRTLSRTVSIPRGFAGAPAAEAGGRSVRDLMREKFLTAAGVVIGPEQAAGAAGLIEDLESLPAAGVARLLDLSCRAVPEPKT
jgi:hypothetical protein